VFCPPSPGYEVFRGLFERLEEAGLGNAAVVRVEDEGLSDVALAAMVGGLFLDRLPAGLWAKGGREALCRGVLQSAGARRYRTEFVSCPGCGRTLFDLQASTREVKRVLSGFPRLKIAVMGCVVNGPGEMGDADYGYVGAGRGLVTLYKGGRVARREVPEGEAVEALRRLVMEGEG
jgi:(E)-4-hydroxy-3-methylbut-2-enyl-diphosphate synthase